MLVIKEAYYGRGANVANVTSHVQSLIKDGGIDVQVSAKTMGADPSVGDEKSLSVTYVADGNQEQRTIPDGSTFSVYSAKESKTASGAVTSGAWSIFKSLGAGLGTFLHLVGVGVAYKVGVTLFSTVVAWILVAISFLIPFFGLWGIPLLVFVYRLFSSTDLFQNGLPEIPIAKTV